MKSILCSVLLLIAVFSSVLGQADLLGDKASMRWELDYQIYIDIANDTTYTYDIKSLFHVKENTSDYKSEFVYYPVNLGDEYINSLKDQHNDTLVSGTYPTIWSALHNSLGGGWVHFTNCLLYALETEQLTLTEPLLKRPETAWKPNPPTESYLRTKKWKYYFPLNQNLAAKEYKKRIKENKPGDLNNLPESFIQLFLNTSEKEYQKLQENNELNTLAKINLVKIILGANYLGEAQINFVRSTVLNAVKNYNIKVLPSVIIFDEFSAAAIMSMNLDGYNIESIAFKEGDEMTVDERDEKIQKIEKIVSDINVYNQNSFRKRLGEYYSN